MKVLWITEFFPTGKEGELVGGVEARSFYVSKYFSSSIKLQVLYRQSSMLKWSPANWKSVFDRCLYLFKAFTVGLTTDFDLIEANNSAVYVIAWLIGKIKRKPVVFWVPDIFLGSRRKMFGSVGVLGDISDFIAFHLPVDKYIVISQQIKNKLIAMGIEDNKIEVVYCGVDREEIPKRVSPQRKYDVVAISRLQRYKRIRDLILAVKILKNKYPKIKVGLLGEGPEKNNLTGLVHNLNLQDNVQFIAPIKKHTEVLNLLSSAKVFSHPSIVEGFGIVLIEAASLGVPYVASNIPVIREISENGQGGLLFEPKNSDDLAGKIDQLLSNKPLYEQKNKEGSVLAKNYSWEKVAQQTSKVYENLYSH